MSERLETLALVGRVVDYRDSDRVLTLLTRDGGKLSALARGARRSRKRFGGALALFVVGEAALTQRRGAEMWTLERFDAREDLAPRISADVVKVAHGSYMLELAREIWPTAEVDAARFDTLYEALALLAAADEPSATLLRAFEVKLLVGAGVMPSIDACVRCGVAVAIDSESPGAMLGFSVTSGGVICADCGPHGWPLGGDVIDELSRLSRAPLADALGREVPREVRLRCRELMMMVVQHNLGRAPKSLEFIAQLAGPGRR